MLLYDVEYPVGYKHSLLMASTIQIWFRKISYLFHFHASVEGFSTVILKYLLNLATFPTQIPLFYFIE